MRLEILPQLASLFNTQLVDTLSRTISILQDEDQWMGAIAESWLEGQPPDGLDVAALRDLPRALTRRLIRNVLRREGSTLTDLTFDQVEAVRGLLDEGKSGKTIQLPGKMRVSREFNRLVFSAVDEVAHEFDYTLSIPGSIHIPQLNRLFRATCLDESNDATMLSEGPTRVLVDGDRLGSCVKIRSWKPGDYYKPTGWPAGKVKKLFQRARVPRRQRRCWPIFTTDSTIIWVTSFPVSREFTPSGFSKKIVAFEALEG
jgi:tRNA(Ile)-lysidine synthase